MGITDEVDKSLSLLAERLTPVLVPMAGEKVGAVGDRVMESLSPLAERIFVINDKLNELNLKIMHLIGKLDI